MSASEPNERRSNPSGLITGGCFSILFSVLAAAVTITWMVERVPKGRHTDVSPYFGYFPYMGVLSIALFVFGILLFARAALIQVEEAEERQRYRLSDEPFEASKPPKA